MKHVCHAAWAALGVTPRKQPGRPCSAPGCLITAPYTQPSEPFLFPKLRNYFADFPQPPYSID